MKKRLAIIGLGLAVAVGVGAVVYWALTPTPGVTVENFKRLETGMTEREFDAVLGEGGECRVVPQPVPPGQTPLAIYSKSWVGNEMTVTICFHDFSPEEMRSGYALSGHCQLADGSSIALKRYQGSFFDDTYWWMRGVLKRTGLV